METEFEHLGHRIVIPEQEGRLPGSEPHSHSAVKGEARVGVMHAGPHGPAAPQPAPAQGKVHAHMHIHQRPFAEEGQAPHGGHSHAPGAAHAPPAGGGHTHAPPAADAGSVHLHLHRYGDAEGATPGHPHVRHVHLHLYPLVHEHGAGAPPGDGGHTHPPGECCPECCPYANVPGHVHGGEMIPGIPEMLFAVFIDDVEHTIHRLSSGRFHTHELPFHLHPDLESAARAIVDHRERFHG
jgi:hypothetical protein